MKYIISLVTRFIPRHYLQDVSAFFLKIIAVAYSGNRYQDPIDGKKYRKLLPYGRTQMRSNALAPRSMSLERHRLIWLYLQHETNFFSAALHVLHVAPEYCFLKKFKRQGNLNYITADLISPWADVKMDIQEIPFPDSHFDVVLCNHVLEHVDSDIKAMQEICRVLKPDGFAILQVPIDLSLETTLENPEYNTPQLREMHYNQRDHQRLYGRDYAQRLRSAGFTVDENNFVKTLPHAQAERYALPMNETLYICKKTHK